VGRSQGGNFKKEIEMAAKKKTARKSAPKKKSVKKSVTKKTKKAPKKAPKKTTKPLPKAGLKGKKTVKLEVGNTAPAFQVADDQGNTLSLAQFAGKKVVLYFYPKDDTPGCTREACDFRDSMNRLKSGDTVVLGVSKDSVASHQKFKTKYGLNFPLLADVEGALCQAYGVWQEKKNYGKTYMGIVRSTFVIDQSGRIVKAFSNVKVDGHVDAVLSALEGI